MKFKDFVRERDVQRIKEINEFFNQPLNIITEIIEIGKTRVIKLSETNYSVKYIFKVSNDVYEVMLGKEKDNIYQMSFFLEDGDRQVTNISNKFQPAKVYSGLLDTVKLFIEEKNPDKIIMKVTLPKKFKHFYKMVKYVFKKYNNIFGGYNVKNMGKEKIDDIIEYDVLVIKKEIK